MLFAIDVGNTNIVLGGIDNGKILFVERLSTDHNKTALEYALSFRDLLDLHGFSAKDVSAAMIASVVPPVTSTLQKALEKITDASVMTVGPGLKTGLNVLMDNPAQVGADLIVGAVAGIHEYACPLVIIDMGTATTMCVLDKDKRYIGGMIMPGLRASLDSLTSRTSQLPRIDLNPPRKLIGKNTVDCMKSGILYGHASCLDGMIDRIQEDLGAEVTVVATGGLAGRITPLCRHSIILDDELLLKGLWLLYEKNGQGSARNAAE